MNIHFSSLAGYIIQVALGVRFLKPDCRRNGSILQCQDTGHRFHRAGRPKHMACHTFCTADSHLVSCFSKGLFKRHGFGLIIKRRTRSMRIYIGVCIRMNAGLLHGLSNGARDPLGLRLRHCHMIGIRSIAIAAELRINLRAAP